MRVFTTLRPAFILWLALSAGQATAQPTPPGMDELRARSLELVNQAREARDLAPLAYTESLNEAAGAHARDMLERNFYAHVSPDGRTARDRYLAAGGDDGRVTRENIARCAGCPVPPGVEAVEALHEGWMESPGHRENILAGGLAGYGFGIAYGQDGRRFAVQTFDGPGTAPADLVEGEPEPLAPQAQTELAVALINEMRGDAQPMAAASRLVDHAASALPEGEHAEAALRDLDVLSDLPAGLPFRRYQVLFGRCGGCGTTATDADVHFFLDQWREGSRDLLTREALTGIGLAIGADGEGSKIAIAILAGP